MLGSWLGCKLLADARSSYEGGALGCWFTARPGSFGVLWYGRVASGADEGFERRVGFGRLLMLRQNVGGWVCVCTFRARAVAKRLKRVRSRVWQHIIQ